MLNDLWLAHVARDLCCPYTINKIQLLPNVNVCVSRRPCRCAMNKNEKYIPAGAIWFGFLLLAVFANFLREWLLLQQLTPFTVLMLLMLGIGVVVQRVRGKPILPTRRVPVRYFVASVLILLSGLLFYYLLAYLGLELLSTYVSGS